MRGLSQQGQVLVGFACGFRVGQTRQRFGAAVVVPARRLSGDVETSSEQPDVGGGRRQTLAVQSQRLFVPLVLDQLAQVDEGSQLDRLSAGRGMAALFSRRAIEGRKLHEHPPRDDRTRLSMIGKRRHAAPIRNDLDPGKRATVTTELWLQGPASPRALREATETQLPAVRQEIPGKP
jgi:hypothetical protein